MQLLRLKQQQVTDGGLSLAPPSSFSAASFRSRFYPASSTNPAVSTATAKTTSSSKEESSSSSVEETGASISHLRKRKAGDVLDRDHDGKKQFTLTGSVDLYQSMQPLPPGWEQCLDLQSGQMSYLNSLLQIRTWHDPRKASSTPINGWNDTLRPRSSDISSLLRTNSYNKRLAKQRQKQQQQKQEHERNEHLDLSLNLSPSSTSSQSTQSWWRDPSTVPVKSCGGGGASITGGVVVVGCRRCLRFVMLPEAATDCPYCGGTVRAADRPPASSLV